MLYLILPTNQTPVLNYTWHSRRLQLLLAPNVSCLTNYIYKTVLRTVSSVIPSIRIYRDFIYTYKFVPTALGLDFSSLAHLWWGLAFSSSVSTLTRLPHV